MDKYNQEEFERYLKEQADQFKLEPTKKVWHGIYNNFHPGRRWPSVATGLMIILLLSITNNLNTKQRQELSSNFKHFSEYASLKEKKNNKLKSKKLTVKSDGDISDNNIITDLLSFEDFNNFSDTNIKFSQNISRSTSSDKPNISLKNDANNLGKNIIDKNVNSLMKSFSTLGNMSDLAITNNDNSLMVENSIDKSNTLENTKILLGKTISSVPIDPIKPSFIPNLKQTINKLSDPKNETLTYVLKKIRLNPIHWNFYISPTINYRILGNANLISSQFGNNGYLNVSTDLNKSSSHHVAPGLELGSGVSFKVLKNLNFLTGLQFNYSGYNARANYTHPVEATILLVRNGIAEPSSTISYLSNDDQSSLTLHNYNIEASIPIGLKYKFLENEHISLSLMSAFQPSMILKQKSYMLSSDAHNYILYPGLKRTFNLNSEVGAFIGFNFHNIKYEIGPEFRYQLLSNYKKLSPYSEHLINYGMRLAINR